MFVLMVLYGCIAASTYTETRLQHVLLSDSFKYLHPHSNHLFSLIQPYTGPKDGRTDAMAKKGNLFDAQRYSSIAGFGRHNANQTAFHDFVCHISSTFAKAVPSHTLW